MKLLIIGNARHGKDTVAEMLAGLMNVKFGSSSLFASESVVFPALRERYGYQTPESCFADRGNHRAEWFAIIQEFNAADPARLAKAVLLENDIYVGMRCRRELAASRDLFDLVIWVDARDRAPLESQESCTVTREDADVVLENNGSLDTLGRRVRRLAYCLTRREDHGSSENTFSKISPFVGCAEPGGSNIANTTHSKYVACVRKASL